MSSQQYADEVVSREIEEMSERMAAVRLEIEDGFRNLVPAFEKCIDSFDGLYGILATVFEKVKQDNG